MPEGDTIHRAAAQLRRALAGRPLDRFEAPRLSPPFPAVGVTVETVEARGKHLLVWFSDGLLLHTHLRMTGSWHVYPRGARWQRARSSARAVLTVPDAVAVCFAAPVVEVLDHADVARHPALRRLGPDLTAPDPDVGAALARMSRLDDPGTPVVAALLDQRVASGIGNVYASELCFLHGLEPSTPVAAVPADTRLALLTEASRLLRTNLSTARRTTVPGAADGTLWVYGRTGRPCRHCGSPIVSDRVGPHARITFWCPGCQPSR